MRTLPPAAHIVSPLLTAGLLAGFTLLSGGCSDSRLDPAGMRTAAKAARDNVPLGAATKPRPVTRPKPRPRPRLATGPTIPTPPYRLDVRVAPRDLALLPADAAVIAALRPDLPTSLSRLLGPHAQHLRRLPGLQWLSGLLGKSLAEPLGLRADRAILVGLLARSGDFGQLAKQLDAQTRTAPKAAAAKLQAALSPARLPATTLHIRFVAQIADAAKTRAGVKALIARARKEGMLPRLTTPAGTPAAGPPKGLAPHNILALSQGPSSAQAWTMAAGRLLVDILLPVSGTWSAARSTRELKAVLAMAAKPVPANPFDRVILLSSADLALLIRGPALAQAARWFGVRALLAVLRGAPAKELGRLVKLGRHVANVPLDFQRTAPRPFDGFGLRLYLVNERPQLHLSWLLTDTGDKLLTTLTKAVAGQDLGANRGLVERWLKPIAARIPKVLPPKGPFAKPSVTKTLFDGGFFMWPLALAEFWPRLLVVKPLRKAVIKLLRTRVRPGRFLRRINVRKKGKLLELVVEGRPPKDSR